jgi:tetratricopeptide (TPR) repeat protein
MARKSVNCSIWVLLFVFPLSVSYTLGRPQATGARPDGFAEAREAASAGQLERAVALYRQVAAAEPKNFRARLELGLLLNAAKRPLESIPAFRTALELEPSSESAELGLSEAYKQVYNYAEARRLLDRASREHPRSALPLIALGELDLQAQEYEKALDHLEHATELAPNNVTARLDLATVYQAKAEPIAALKQLNLAIASDAFPHLSRETAYAYYLRGSLYAERNEDTKAVEDAKRVVALEPDNPRGHTLLARVALRLNQCVNVVSTLEPIVALHQEDPESLYLLARGYQCSGNDARAREMMAQFKKRSEADHSGRVRHQQAEALAAQAGEMARQNQLTPALRILRQALAQDPENGSVNIQLAKIYFSQDHIDQAHEAAAKALKANPYQPEYRYVMGLVRLRQGDLPGALEALQETVEVNPQESDAYYEMGGIYLKLKDRNQAIRCFEKAVALSPEDAHYRQALDTAKKN